MKKTKQTLAFEQLEAEMEALSKELQMNFKGGDGSTGWEYGLDPDGNIYYRLSGSNNWTALPPIQLNEVTITGYSTSTGNNQYDPYNPFGYWSNHYGNGGGGFYIPVSGGGGGGGVTVVPTSQMTASSQMPLFLNNGENFSPIIYTNDNNTNDGPPTIGYGHKLTAEEIANGTYAGRTITEGEAMALFNSDLADAVSSAQRNIHVQLTQQQFDAYVSFAYQQGSAGAANSAVNTLINQGKFSEAAEALRHFSDNTTNSPGLVRRRREEADLFTSGDYTFTPYGS